MARIDTDGRSSAFLLSAALAATIHIADKIVWVASVIWRFFAETVVAPGVCLRVARQAEASQRNACEAGAECLQRPAPRDGSGQVFGQFTRCDGAAARRVELVVHNLPFVLFLFLVWSFTSSRK
jgi:hypothetical protein